MATQNKVEFVVIWNGKAILTMGDTMDAIYSCHNRESFSEFMNLYRQVSKNADENLKFGLSYCYRKGDSERIQGYMLEVELKQRLRARVIEPSNKLAIERSIK